MKSFLIIGMGSFGNHICRSLAQRKCEIMAVDLVSERVEEVLPYVVSGKIGDCTNIEVLRSFGINDFDACFVCVGGSFQNSLEITSLLKELGAKKVFSKADEDIQAKFLLRNGADKVIYPERDVARRIAVIESSDNIFDCIELSDEHSIYEVSVIDKWIDKSLLELNFRTKYDLTILAVRKPDGTVVLPTAGYKFEPDDHPLVFGSINSVDAIYK